MGRKEKSKNVLYRSKKETKKGVADLAKVPYGESHVHVQGRGGRSGASLP